MTIHKQQIHITIPDKTVEPGLYSDLRGFTVIVF